MLTRNRSASLSTSYKFDFLEYGKLLRGPLEWRQLESTPLLAGRGSYLLDAILDEPDELTIFSDRTSNYSLTILEYHDLGGYLFTEIQRRNEIERDERDSQRPYNQTRFTLLSNDKLLRWFQEGYCVYSSLLLSGSSHREKPRVSGNQLHIHLKDYRDTVNLEAHKVEHQLEILSPQHVSKVLDRPLAIRILNTLLKGHRLLVIDAPITFLERLSICEVLQVAIAGTQKILTFALDYVSDRQVDIAFTISGDRYRKRESEGRTTLTLDLRHPIHLNDEEQQLSSLFDSLYKDCGDNRVRYIQRLQEVIANQKGGSSPAKQTLILKAGNLDLDELIKLLNTSILQLGPDDRKGLLDNPSAVTKANNPVLERGRLIYRSLNLTDLTEEYRNQVQNYLADCSLLDVINWINSGAFRVSEAMATFDGLLPEPTASELEQWLGLSEARQLFLTLAQDAEFMFRGKRRILQVVLEYSRNQKTRELLIEFLNADVANGHRALDYALSSGLVFQSTFLVASLVNDLTLELVMGFRELYFSANEEELKKSGDWRTFVEASTLYYSVIDQYEAIENELIQAALPLDRREIISMLVDTARLDRIVYEGLVFRELPTLIHLSVFPEETVRLAYHNLLNLVVKLDDFPEHMSYLKNSDKSAVNSIKKAVRTCIHPYHDVFFVWTVEYFLVSNRHIPGEDIRYLIDLLDKNRENINYKNVADLLTTAKSVTPFIDTTLLQQILPLVDEINRSEFIARIFSERILSNDEVVQFVRWFVERGDKDRVNDFVNFRINQREIRKQSILEGSFTEYLIDKYDILGIDWILDSIIPIGNNETLISLLDLIIAANLQEGVSVVVSKRDWKRLSRDPKYYAVLSQDLRKTRERLPGNVVNDFLPTILTLFGSELDSNDDAKQLRQVLMYSYLSYHEKLQDYDHLSDFMRKLNNSDPDRFLQFVRLILEQKSLTSNSVSSFPLGLRSELFKLLPTHSIWTPVAVIELIQHNDNQYSDAFISSLRRWASEYPDNAYWIVQRFSDEYPEWLRLLETIIPGQISRKEENMSGTGYTLKEWLSELIEYVGVPLVLLTIILIVIAIIANTIILPYLSF